jgi:hypothetical protein
MEIRMVLRIEAVQNSVMPIRKPRANRTSPVDRHLFTDKSCELLINDLTRCAWVFRLKASYKGPLTHPGAVTGGL